MIAFFDASALIYLVEGAESFASRNRRQIEKLRQRTRNLGTAVSQLSWLECRIRPARRNESATSALYDAFSAYFDGTARKDRERALARLVVALSHHLSAAEVTGIVNSLSAGPAREERRGSARALRGP